MTLSPESIFADRFLIQNSLGTFGLARLFDARDTVTGQTVTLKVVPNQSVPDSAAGRRWEREARALLAIDSPFVVRCLDRVDTPEQFGLVTEPLDGVDLRSYAALYGPLPLDSVLSIGLQIARGLHACHVAGVIHRDLRPENVFVAVDETVKIVNFALAGIEDATTLTMTGTMFGEPEYAAPESFVGAPSDVRIDIYSLGVVLWEMVAGESPFQGSGIIQILEQKSSRELARVSSHDPAVPPWLDDLVAAMTAREPDGRPSSLGAVIRSLDQRQRVTLESSSAGQCMACGHRLFRGLDFCSYCGKSSIGDDDTSEVSACVIKAVGDPVAAWEFLRHTFTQEPRRNLDSALRKPPFSLVESGSTAQSRWLVAALEKLRCVVDPTPLPRWYFKQTSVIVTLAISALLMLTADVDSFLPRFRVPENSFGAGIYLLTKIHYVLVCGLAVSFFLRRCGFRLRDQPLFWGQGAWRFVFRPAEKLNVLVIAGRAVLLLAIIGVMFLSAFLLRDIVLAVALTIENVAFSLSSSGFDMPIGYLIGPVLVGSLFPVGILLLIVRFVGRIGGPPLFRLEAADGRRGGVSWGSEDIHVLGRLRAVNRSTDWDDLRFVISDTIESYVSLVRIKSGMASHPGRALYELQEKIQFAIEIVVSSGESAVELGRRASPEIKEALEASILKLRRKVAEEEGSAAEHAAALLRDAEEEVILWEVDSDLVNRKLNAMRVVGGEIRASVAQLFAIAGDIGDEERARRELAQLSETLLALNPARTMGPTPA